MCSWAVDATRFAAELRPGRDASVTDVDESLTRLDRYVSAARAASALQACSSVSRSCAELNNGRLLQQCTVASDRCQQARQLLSTRRVSRFYTEFCIADALILHLHTARFCMELRYMLIRIRPILISYVYLITKYYVLYKTHHYVHLLCNCTKISTRCLYESYTKLNFCVLYINFTITVTSCPLFSLTFSHLP